MAKKFGDTKGSGSSGLDKYEMTPGENKFRLFGDIRPRYVYWTKDAKGNAVAVECLRFNPETESFDNADKDHFLDFFPYKLDADGNIVTNKEGEKVPFNAQWGYVALVLDLNDGTPENPQPKIFYLKKKMFEELLRLGQKRLGDPTDPEKGWDVVVERVKTGPMVFNVEYNIDQLACSEGRRPLTDAEKEAIEDIKSIDELVPRPTSEQQLKFIKTNLLGEGATDDSNDADDAAEAAEGAETAEDI